MATDRRRLPILRVALSTLALPALVLLLVTMTPARADSWMAPQPAVASSPDGRWYVILNPADSWSVGKVALVKRGDGLAPRVGPATEGNPFEEKPGIEPESGDEVVARAESHLPMEMRCLDDGKGFVLFENHGGVGRGIVLARYDGGGRRLWTLHLQDLFTGDQIRAFSHTVSSIWWYEGFWVDQANGRILVVPHGLPLVSVALEDGKVGKAAPEALLACLGRGTEAEQVMALEVARRLKPEGLLGLAQEGFARAGVPLAVRLRLAVILAQEGDATGAEFIRAMTAKGQPDDLRRYAVEHLPVAIGTEALPILREMLRGDADEGWHAAQRALVSMGEAALDTLREMLLEEGESADYRGAAAHALGRMGEVATPVVPALLEAAQRGEEYVANAALNALVAIVPPKELGPRLVALLAKGSGDDGRIALFFTEHPMPDAVPALRAARARHAEDESDTTRTWIDEALEACRGR